MPFPIIDSHIHLYAKSDLGNLAWTGSLPQDHVLLQQNSVEQYRAASSNASTLKGFIFVETDRISGLEEHEWSSAIDEIDFLGRIKSSQPLPGQGHSENDASFLLGVVAWAPLPAGVQPLNRYLERAEKTIKAKTDSNVLKGFRYLVQDKPQGTLLNPAFVDGLCLIERKGYASFDLGVDARSAGLWQLEEAISMLDAFYARSNKSLNIVVNHMCKPNVRLSADQAVESQEFQSWKAHIQELAKFPTVYMKLSGLFSELPVQSTASPTTLEVLSAHTKPWLDVIFTSFGPRRIMFGSDWPVCNVGGPGPDASWQHWYNFVAHIIQERGLSQEDQARIWAGTANEAYRLEAK